MNSINSSLGELLFQQPTGIPDPVWLKILEKPPVLAIVAHLSPDILKDTQTELRSCVAGLFQTKLVDLLLAGWNRYQEVADSLEASRQKPADIFLRPLVEHTLKTVQHPYVEVFADNKSVGKIVFGLTLALDVKALTLKMQQGRISEIESGSCQGSIELAYDDDVLASAKTGNIPLPGAIKLGAAAASPEPVSSTDATMVAPKPVGHAAAP